MSNNTVVKVIAGAAAVAAIVGAAFYLFKESGSDAVIKADIENSSIDMSVEEFTAMLDKVISTQKECTDMVRKLSQDLIANSSQKPTFQAIYDAVKDQLPADPVTSAGLNMQQFDELIARFDSNSEVTTRLERILRASNHTVNHEKSSRLKKKDIVEVYKFMFEEMSRLFEDYKSLQQEGFIADPKVTILAVQTLISAATEERFGLPSVDVEAAAAANQRSLVTDPEFGRYSMLLQQLLAAFMGAQME